MNGDLPAFPVVDNGQPWLRIGLTKREYFAGLAMQGMMAHEGMPLGNAADALTDLRDMATLAIAASDALLAELAR